MLCYYRLCGCVARVALIEIISNINIAIYRATRPNIFKLKNTKCRIKFPDLRHNNINKQNVQFIVDGLKGQDKFNGSTWNIW